MAKVDLINNRLICLNHRNFSISPRVPSAEYIQVTRSTKIFDHNQISFHSILLDLFFYEGLNFDSFQKSETCITGVVRDFTSLKTSVIIVKKKRKKERWLLRGFYFFDGYFLKSNSHDKRGNTVPGQHWQTGLKVGTFESKVYPKSPGFDENWGQPLCLNASPLILNVALHGKVIFNGQYEYKTLNINCINCWPFYPYCLIAISLAGVLHSSWIMGNNAHMSCTVEHCPSEKVSCAWKRMYHLASSFWPLSALHLSLWSSLPSQKQTRGCPALTSTMTAQWHMSNVGRQEGKSGNH